MPPLSLGSVRRRDEQPEIKIFSSVIARSNAVRDEGGNICEAHKVILLGEEGRPETC